MSQPADFVQLKKLMCLAASIQEKDLTKVESTVIFAHYATKSVGMKCVNRKGQTIEFPEDWRKDFEGVYKFNYKIEKGGEKIIMFRFLDCGEGDGKIRVNFVEEDKDEMHHEQIQYEETNFQQNLKRYKRKVEESLKLKQHEKKQENSNNLEVRRLQPQWRAPRQNPNSNPLPFNPPTRPNDSPFGMPFQGDEYVGPNSGIFGGNGNMPPNMQGPSMRRPPGSRFDPIDPFGNDGFGDDPGSRDFSGFNNWGQPFGGRGGRGGNGGNYCGFH